MSYGLITDLQVGLCCGGYIDTGNINSWEWVIKLWQEFYVTFPVQTRALCSSQKNLECRGNGKGILMASFNSWQDSGMTLTLPLMGGGDPGGTFVQALTLWHFREKWNYESNLVKPRVCVWVACECCKMGSARGTGTTFIHIHLVSCHEHRQHKRLTEDPLWWGIMVMVT